ncbi:MAG: D-alanyl-D-alanine dipeptidase [Syntrophus sp. PtaU1.Bin208]|nr:MAG: D-alanyl-D-alanine dipeptidase [Syntrophus sp. PtaU1.Bin208]
MRYFFMLLFAALLLVMVLPCYAREISQCGQVIVSVTESWNESHATLYLFERKNDRWQKIGKGIEAVVGRLGLAWDSASDGYLAGEPVKAEGDLKAPSGIFTIPLAMGMSLRPPVGVALPYRQIVKGTHCVDDPSSRYYNVIVRESELSGGKGRDWKSSERMWEIADLYRLLMVVGYNTLSPKPGRGSCIFLHIGHPSGKPTSGCTALSESDLTKIMKWLSPGKNPVLVQLPRDVYARVWKIWHLPSPSLIEDRAAEKNIPLVNIQDIVPDVAVEMRYAGSDNFTKRKIYDCGRCFLRAGTAAKVAIAQRELKKKGLSLKMWDCYRPLSAQKLFWSLVPDPRFVADPKTGSRHNRGNAVDVTLMDSSGSELEMPTVFDDFSPRAGHGEKNISRQAIENRRLLAEVMEKAGFKRFESEWWHYDDGDVTGEIIDVSFDELCR